ncbi:hypothetical protein F5Y10DRAFT_235429 [Nemania abortiva]|nr:hypothetical protein F5Y10DRAFT_235429 [Nemania abortiva]
MNADDIFRNWSFDNSIPHPGTFHLQADGAADYFQFENSTQEQNVMQHAESTQSRVLPYTNNSMSVAASVRQPEEDMTMTDFNTQYLSGPVPPVDGPQTRKRTKYRHLHWDAHKNEIRELYLDQDCTLKDTMEIMANTRSFNASEKLYKKKFKEWGWSKNLPVEMAVVMAQKMRERKQKENKDTVFIYGGRQIDYKKVEDTISRAKRSRTDQVPINAETPQGVDYETPTALMLSPGNDDSDEEQEDWDTLSESTDADEAPQLSWQGKTGSDFLDMWKSALALSKQNKAAGAEVLLKEALDGLCRVSGTTHEDTKKVCYDLANLYAETDRVTEAIRVVEKVIRDHVKILGFQSRETQQVVLQVVELLNAWNRHTEALGLLARANEILDSSSISTRARNSRFRGRRKTAARMRSEPTADSDHISDLTQSINMYSDPNNIEHALGVARSHVASGDENVERLLLATIDKCESDVGRFARQNLIARGELIKLYQKLGTVGNHPDKFNDTIEAYRRLWFSYEWDEDRFACFEFMEAVLQLAANLLKSGYLAEARDIFLEAGEKATSLFGNSDERTVWVYITIGIVYQTYINWESAAEWFEAAFAKALASREWGPKDGIVRSLQAALDKRHFSYLSDEGRPFKTAFGVSGIKIMPGRLHLE